MAGEFTKQDQSLTRGAQLVTSARADLSGQLNTLRGQLSGIVSKWQGAGGASFVTVMQRWDEDTKKIVSALDEFENNLRSSEQTYNAADEAQAATFSKLNSRLG